MRWTVSRHEHAGHEDYAPRGSGTLCPRGEGGCDEEAVYLEGNEGWATCAVTARESAGDGARNEFHKAAMAFRLRELKEETPQHIWVRMRFELPALLDDLLPGGRGIRWDAIDMSQFPLFGARKRLGQRVLTRAEVRRREEEDA